MQITVEFVVFDVVIVDGSPKQEQKPLMGRWKKVNRVFIFF